MPPDLSHDPRLVDPDLADRLATYLLLLRRWNKTINLVSPATLEFVWSRHVADSLALQDHAPPRGRWVDVGSGGGFPGMVLAIAGAPQMSVTLVESDLRKCEFLRTVSRELQLDVAIENRRLDLRKPVPADVVTARALASLTDLLGCVVKTNATAPIGLFPKGAKWEQEVDEARLRWSFDIDVLPSQTEKKAAILKVCNVTPR